MKHFKAIPYIQQMKWRIRILYAAIVLMLIYMIILVEMGGGDSRVMTDFAQLISRIIYFGSLIYMICQIVRDKKLLKNRLLLKEQFQKEQDERNQFLHDKSGGTVLDILLLCLLITTFTTSLFNMAAFYTSVSILILAIVLKVVSYYFLSRS